MRPTADPSPPVMQVKRRDRIRALAGLLIAAEIAAAKAERQALEIARAARVGRDASGYHHGSDLGPGILLARRDRITESVAEPGRPGRSIRRTRRQDVLLDLRRDGQITTQQWDAGESFRLLAERTAVRIAGGGTGEGGRLALWQRNREPRRAEAAMAVDRTLRRLGHPMNSVIVWLVLANGSPRAWESANRLRHGAGVFWLREALNRLVQNGTVPPPQTRTASAATRATTGAAAQDRRSGHADRQSAEPPATQR